jgi:hypothetical protein
MGTPPPAQAHAFVIAMCDDVGNPTSNSDTHRIFEDISSLLFNKRARPIAPAISSLVHEKDSLGKRPNPLTNSTAARNAA